MRKLLFSFLILVAASVVSAESTVCDLIAQENPDCSYSTQISYTSSTFATANTATDDLPYGAKSRTLSWIYNIAGVQIRQISVDGWHYEMRYRPWNADRTGCDLNKEDYTRYFSEHYDMQYNSQHVGDCYFYNRDDGFDIYCVWDDSALANVPDGGKIDAVFVNRWYPYP